jgi:HSP20 family molecular chaperone IbpA
MKSAGIAKAPTNAVPITPTAAATLEWQMQQMQIGIARRAYELFEARGYEHGHDWEDWFRAESELLRPVSMAISDSKTRVSVRANVLGFEATELRVGVEPNRIIILGIKRPPSELARILELSWYPDQVFRTIALPTEVVPGSAQIELDAGVLRIELTKATKPAALAG